MWCSSLAGDNTNRGISEVSHGDRLSHFNSDAGLKKCSRGKYFSLSILATFTPSMNFSMGALTHLWICRFTCSKLIPIYTADPCPPTIFSLFPYMIYQRKHSGILGSRKTVWILFHLWTGFIVERSYMWTGGITGKYDARYMLEVIPVFYFLPQTEFLAVIKTTTEGNIYRNLSMCYMSHALKLYYYVFSTLWWPLSTKQQLQLHCHTADKIWTKEVKYPQLINKTLH